MIQTLKQLLTSQFEASLGTLGLCVVKCPPAIWNVPIARFPFCQTAFHTLFFADYYLGADPDSLQNQEFHTANPQIFGDYEQLQRRDPVSIYSQQQIERYLGFCRDKAVSTIAVETEQDLTAPTKFPRRNFSRAELHVYNIRHIQHHAAQLILRLRQDSDVDIPWVGAGWPLGK
jgi:hypothetical protein